MTGRLIFLTITALPESDAATSLLLKCLFSNNRRIASVTAAPSMMVPSTMLSGGIGSAANAATLKPLPAGFSSTALTALDPMSSPTTAFDLPRPNTAYVLHAGSLPRRRGRNARVCTKTEHFRKRDTNLDQRPACRKAASDAENCDRRRPNPTDPSYSFVSR